ncbi:unnamed protein product [Gongylonema pulchrum]|uniref:FXYD domain-containing ion transport regulator n=1 Tax=Gongylonema pulchrum TaxID=637853 RepID=A0A183E0G3_9BILA|nr:unnamed protein product [Gongylonema pulchrum]
MLSLAHFSVDNSSLSNLEDYYRRPIQLAGSVFLISGLFLVLASLICTLLSVKEPAGIYEKSPYQTMPPPAYPVLENRYTQMARMFSPHSELKLYPPVLVFLTIAIESE